MYVCLRDGLSTGYKQVLNVMRSFKFVRLLSCVFCRTEPVHCIVADRHSFNIETLLECPICLSECTDPRVLPCLHSLCRTCLQYHIKTSAEGNNFNCPSCRHQSEVPPGGVTALPNNFLFNSLKEMLQQQSGHDAATISPKRVTCWSYRATVFSTQQGKPSAYTSHSILLGMCQLLLFQRRSFSQGARCNK